MRPKVGKDVTWVKPELVAEVKFANWTHEGRLRAPVYLGLRPDADAARCVREVAEAKLAARAGPSPARRKSNEVTLTIDASIPKFTNLNKIFYPAEGIVKRDLLNYYDAVAYLILPHLQRPAAVVQALSQRHRAAVLFQKDAPQTFAPWLRAEEIYSDHNERPSATSSPRTAPACSISSTSAASTITPG